MIHQALHKAMTHQNLERAEALEAMNAIMSGEASEAEIAAFLVAMRMKGETATEVAGFAEAMRRHATPVKTRHADAIDVCGTGGDGMHTFNISTIAAFVVAGGGVPVAKHGNRSVSSRCGSADVLTALGVNILLTAEQMGRCLDEVGMAFLFAPSLHGAMRHAAGPRKAIGVKTVFNILGPITNPAGVKRQLIGVFDAGVARLLALVLRELGTVHALVVHGSDGLDEVTLHDRTFAVELQNGEVRESYLSPDDFALPWQSRNGVSEGDVTKNAEMVWRVLQGEAGELRDTVLANAACGFFVAGAAKDLAEGIWLARESLDSGAALAKLEQLRQFSNAPAA